MLHRTPWALAIILATSLFSFPPTGAAQTEKLDELKAQYQAEVDAAEIELKKKYSAALERIQQDLQSRAQLTGALAVKRERDKIEAELAAVGGGTNPVTPGVPPTPNPSGKSEFVLAAEKAKPLGEVVFTQRWEALTGWRESGSGAEWELGSVPKGVYNLEIEYSCPAAGGTLMVKHGSAEFEIPVSGTGTWVDYQSVEAGQVITDPYQPLSITVIDDANAPFGLINLKSIKLKSIQAGS